MAKKSLTANNVAKCIVEACHGFTFDELAIGCQYETTKLAKGQGKAEFNLDFFRRNGRYKITVEKLN